ncbi:MAG: DUF2293 domain-containing protein [Bacteroidota bacterium]
MSPGKNGQVINEYGMSEKPPTDWLFLPAGDAAITRKVTAKGKYWRVQIKKGRRLISKGLWAPADTINEAKRLVSKMRNNPGYEQKKASAKRSREKKQQAYESAFEKAVSAYLNFHKDYKVLELKMAKIVTKHAIPVGSGTVARTSMIPLEERASKAVIAWMRHQTTNYDQMKIARIKGERRSVRKKLANNSVQLLKSYREGKQIIQNCPLYHALTKEVK